MYHTCMAPYNGLMLLTTQPLALRKKREEDERMNQRFKISEKPKDCVIRIDDSNPRNNRNQNKRRWMDNGSDYVWGALWCLILKSVQYTICLLLSSGGVTPKGLPGTSMCIPAGPGFWVCTKWGSALHKLSLFCPAPGGELLSSLGSSPFFQADFSQALGWLKDSPGDLAWKSVPKAKKKKKRRARLKYQPRIYALDLRFNNATENQYLIKQMMEKNTAREMRLLRCFQTSQSQRRLGWQNGLKTRLTRESGMQTIAGPIDSYSVISERVGHFH